MSNIYTNPNLEVIRHNPLWKAQLTNGVVVYQNNFHEPKSSWIELKEYLESNKNVFIKRYWIQFRDNCIQVGEDALIYFFMRKFYGSFDGLTKQEYYLVGSSNDIRAIKIDHFIVPELLEKPEDGIDIRDPLSSLCRRGIIVHPQLLPIFEDYYGEKI